MDLGMLTQLLILAVQLATGDRRGAIKTILKLVLPNMSTADRNRLADAIDAAFAAAGGEPSRLWLEINAVLARAKNEGLIL
jgi:hypothetical protein